MNKVSLAKAIFKTVVYAAAWLGALTIAVAYPMVIMILLFAAAICFLGYTLYKITMEFYEEIEKKKTK